LAKKRKLTVMTQNVYFGADLGPVLTAGSPSEFVEAAARAWSQVQASLIPERADSIARCVATLEPDLVALQEVVQWFSGGADGVRVAYDFLESILTSLRNHGIRYEPLAIMNDLDQTCPLNMNGDLLRLLDRHAILLRVDPAVPDLEPRKIRTATYTSLVQLPFEMGAVPRSWITVDAVLDGVLFRLIETHLESFRADIQTAQARELVADPADTQLPTIMLGDFNSNANQEPTLPDHTATYPELIAGGFEDVWRAVNPNEAGHTGVQAADLRNQVSLLDRRIDLILTRGGAEPISAQLVGDSAESRTPSGLWPSDHAGIVASIQMPAA
jgi:endonuclease/exonuclease/phosphatase family metal-dependent hydrolase